VGERSSIAGGGREIATSHNMRDVMRMAAAWYGTGIGGGGGGGKTTMAQKAMTAAAPPRSRGEAVLGTSSGR